MVKIEIEGNDKQNVQDLQRAKQETASGFQRKVQFANYECSH